MNLQRPLLSAGKQYRTVIRSFASRLFSSTLFYACCLLLTFLLTAGFTYYKKWWASTYVQTATSSFPTTNFIGRVITGDFDKDGDEDILYQAGTDGAAVMFAASNGNRTFAAAVTQSASPFRNVPAFNINNSFTHVKDFDEDGDDDVWIGIASSTGTYLRNDNGTFTSQSSGTFPNPQFPGRPVSGDFDDDGDIDFLYQTGADGSAFMYARNDGNASFTLLSQAGSPFAGVALADMTFALTIVADFDHDGDQDIWVPIGGTTGRYFRNDGANWSEPSSAGFPAPQFPGRVKVADYDNDGDPDILYQTGVDGSAFGYYQNNGNATFTNTGIAGSPLNGLTLPNLLGNNYNIVDFDADGDIDIYSTVNNTQGTYFVQQSQAGTPPSIQFPLTRSVTEDQASPITGISVSDADAGTVPVTVSFRVASGTLAATSGSGVTVSGSATDSITLTGTVDNINSFIAASHISYTTTLNGTADIQMLVSHTENTGAGTPRTVRVVVTLQVSAVNDAPQLYLPPAINGIEDQPASLSGIEFRDVDAGNNPVTVSFTVSSGTLTATSGGGVTVGGTSTAMILTGTIGNINSFLYANNLNYLPPANFSGVVPLTVVINDRGFTGSGGTQRTTGNTVLSIASTNDKPMVTLPAPISVTEDLATALTGISFSDVDAGNALVTVTLSVSSGSLTATSGGGVAVGGTANVMTLTGSIANINAFIAASNISYQTALNAPVNITMQVSINDNGNTGAGGPQTASDNLTLVVSAVNDAPVNTVPGSQQTDMNTSLTFSTGNSNQISIGDLDMVNPAITQLEVTLTATNGLVSLGGTTGLLFSVGSGVANATMTFKGSLNDINVALANTVFAPTNGFTGAASLQITTSDLGNTGSGGLQTDSDNIPITVNATNPLVTTVQSTNPNGTYKAGDLIGVTIIFNQPVIVNPGGGTPSILLETGTTDRAAQYFTGSGTNTLTFNYFVQAGDATSDLNYVSTTALALNGGSIKNAANGDAILTLPTVSGANSLGGQRNIVIDGIAPTITSVNVPANGTYIAGQFLDFTVNYSEAVVVNTSGGTPYLNIIVGSAAMQATYVSGSGTNALTFRYTVQNGNLDPNGITVGAHLQTNGSTIKDLADNNAGIVLQNLGNTVGILVDAVAPTVAISTAAANPVNGTFTITITFSEAMTGFAAGDLTGSNCTFSAFTQADPQTYTVLVTPATDGALSINIAAGVAQDLAGNANTASNTLTRNYDGTAPGIVISSTAPNPVSAAFTVTFTCSEAMNGFTATDITLSNATLSNFVTLDPQTYTALITPISDGMVAISVAANKATDPVGNGNTASNTLNRTFDGTVPSVVISTTAVSPVNQPFTIQLVFSETVTGLTAGDLTIGNGTASNLQTTDNITYSVLITPTANGPVTVQLPAATVVDAAWNANSISNQLIISYDIIAPTVTLTKSIGGATNAPFTINIQFSEVVNGFVVTDLALTNATASNLQTTDNKNYTALITPGVDGTVTMTVPAGIANDQATNPNTASAALSVLYDITRPAVAISTTAPNPVKGPFNITITFNEAVNGFAANDLTILNGTISNLQTNNNSTFTATVQPVAEGVVSVSVKSGGAVDRAGNTNTASATLSRNFDITAPVITVKARNVSIHHVTAPFTVEFRSNEKIQGLTLDEIMLTNGVASNLVKENDFVYTATITPVYAREQLTVQLPAGTVEDLAGNPNAASNKLSVMVFGSARIVKLYPVPTRGPLTILFEGILERKTKIMVMDVAGRIFYTREYQMTSKQLQLNFSGLMPVGVYHLVVINDGFIDRRNIVIAP